MDEDGHDSDDANMCEEARMHGMFQLLHCWS